MERTAQPKSVRILAEFLVVGICTVGFIFTALGIGTGVAGHNGPGGRRSRRVPGLPDSRSWPHRRRPIRRRNAMQPLERSAGLDFSCQPHTAGNAPPALLLVVPLGFVSAKLGELLWIFLLLACFIASVRIVRSMHGAPKNKRHYLGYTFAPALLCLGEPPFQGVARSFFSGTCSSFAGKWSVPISQWGGPLVLYAEAAALSAFRVGAVCVDHRFEVVPDPRGRRKHVRRLDVHRVSSGSTCLGTISRDDGRVSL